MIELNDINKKMLIIATGKLMIGKRPGAIGVMNKSQTLPRNMGGRAMTNGIGACINKHVPKPLQTPPAVRRQFSVRFYLVY